MLADVGLDYLIRMVLSATDDDLNQIAHARSNSHMGDRRSNDDENNSLIRRKLQVIRAFVRVTAGRRYVRKLEGRLTTDPNNPFRFVAQTAGHLNDCPVYNEFLDRQVKWELWTIHQTHGRISMQDLRSRYPRRDIK